MSPLPVIRLFRRFRRFRRFALGCLCLSLGCKAQIPAITEPFTEDFERVEIGPTWLNTGADYRISSGKLNIKGAHNHPLWLRRRLPRDVVVDVDVMSKSPAGDIKVELFGDGETFDPDGNQYQPSGYTMIFGGWNNQLSVICRLNEHDDGVKARRTAPAVEMNRTYHWTITRRGGAIDWKIDGQPFLSWTDDQPLAGSGHEFFAVGNWETDVYFDNLRIRGAPP